jgi:hypothetical protein
MRFNTWLDGGWYSPFDRYYPGGHYSDDDEDWSSSLAPLSDPSPKPESPPSEVTVDEIVMGIEYVKAREA